MLPNAAAGTICLVVTTLLVTLRYGIPVPDAAFPLRGRWLRYGCLGSMAVSTLALCLFSPYLLVYFALGLGLQTATTRIIWMALQNGTSPFRAATPGQKLGAGLFRLFLILFLLACGSITLVLIAYISLSMRETLAG